MVRPFSALLALGLVAVTLSGCLTGDTPTDSVPALAQVTAHEYRYAGDDVVVDGVPYGWMVRFTNNGTDDVGLHVEMFGTSDRTYGPVTANGWQKATVPLDGLSGPLETTGPVDLTQVHHIAGVLHSNTSVLYLFQSAAGDIREDLGYRVYVTDAPADTPAIGQGPLPFIAGDFRVLEGWQSVRGVQLDKSGPKAVPHDKVKTLTVGVWTNGTSFYTNIADLNADATFPAGYDREQFGGDPLPIYVYDQDRREQPVGNRDRCWFTTISGYNALLKSQAELGTNARFLTPEEGYTVAGAEDHFLYGEALVFLNTVVAHEGQAEQAEEAPDPTAPCFQPRNAERKLPPLPPASLPDTEP
ncbi:MAG: hypothetical protein KY455_09745 [Euryarchaeota archaeon]|nr:hypothetical protein [Euryarchaeota archaeon]